MPCIFMYNGWKIYMYYEDHLPPHFHLLNKENEFRVHLTGELHSVVRGDIRSVDWKFVRDLARRNANQLQHNWHVVKNGGQMVNLV